MSEASIVYLVLGYYTKKASHSVPPWSHWIRDTTTVFSDYDSALQRAMYLNDHYKEKTNLLTFIRGYKICTYEIDILSNSMESIQDGSFSFYVPVEKTENKFYLNGKNKPKELLKELQIKKELVAKQKKLELDQLTEALTNNSGQASTNISKNSATLTKPVNNINHQYHSPWTLQTWPEEGTGQGNPHL